MSEKARYWCAICYPENMIDDWKDEIAHILQMPFCYGWHNQDLDKDGKTIAKEHVHLVLPFDGPTTQKNVINVANKLSKPGEVCCSAAQSIMNMRYMYNYLIHDTDDARKKHKYQYDESHRVEGNNFDIHFYEQLSAKDKQLLEIELIKLIREKQFVLYGDLMDYVIDNLDMKYYEVLSNKNSMFEKLTRSNYLKYEKAKQDFISHKTL